MVKNFELFLRQENMSDNTLLPMCTQLMIIIRGRRS